MPECFYESGTERFVDTIVSVDELASKFSVEDWDVADLEREHQSRMGQVRAGFDVSLESFFHVRNWNMVSIDDTISVLRLGLLCS